MNVDKINLDVLKKIKKYDPSRINGDDIPMSKGIYAWFHNKTQEIVNIGSAVGKEGLHGRVWKQVLNPNYLEKREKLFTKEDDFQVKERPIYVNGKIAIDKARFRRNLARVHKIRAGNDSVDFIKKIFVLGFLEIEKEDSSTIQELKKKLIAQVNPKYNIAGKEK